MKIKLTKTQRILIESSGDIARIMRQILLRENRVSAQRDHLWTIGLSEEYKMKYVELIAFGIPAKNEDSADGDFQAGATERLPLPVHLPQP